MSDDPVQKPPAYNRVSLRAVLVREGEDATAALAEAGFVDVISIPVVLGEDSHLLDGILGNGITPNLPAVLETIEPEAPDTSPGLPPGPAGSEPDAALGSERATTNLPAAFGTRALAPVGQSANR